MSDVDRTPTTADGPSKQSSAAIGTDAYFADRTSATRPRGTLRALVAGLITAIMLVVTLGVAVFAQGGTTVPGPTFLPATSLAYAEARLDFPGDQRDQLMAFLGHLPGFADPAAFDTKLDETIDQLLGGGEAPISWSEDIKPWFSGQVMFGMPELPELSTTITSKSATAAAASGINALGVTDRAALDAALAKLLGSMGDAVTSEEYGGTTVSTVANADGTLTALAPTDDLLLFSNDAALVKGSLDVLSGSEPSLADDPGFQAAIAALPADRVGAFVLDIAQLKDALGPLLEEQLATQPEMAASAPQILALLEFLPPTLTGYIRVDADHLTFRLDAPIADSAPAIAVRSTDLASKMPADTIVYLESRDLGVAIKALVEQLKPLLAQQGNDDALAQIEALLGTGLESYLDWVGDIAIGASVGASGPSVGLAATVSDETVGQKRVDSLVTLIRLISVSRDPSPVEITQEDVNGVTITTITLTDASGMTQRLPVEAKVSVAVGDGHLYIGLGDFVTDALSRDPAESLAASPGYTKALDAVGEENAGILYADVASTLSFATLLTGSDDREMFDSQFKPYADALDFIVASLNQDETSTSASRMLFVK